MAMEDYLADMSILKLEEEIWRAEEALRIDILKCGGDKDVDNYPDPIEGVNINEQETPNNALEITRTSLQSNRDVLASIEKDIRVPMVENTFEQRNTGDGNENLATIHYPIEETLINDKHESTGSNNNLYIEKDLFLGLQNRYRDDPIGRDHLIQEHLLQRQAKQRTMIENEDPSSTKLLQDLNQGSNNDKLMDETNVDDEINRIENEIHYLHTHKHPDKHKVMIDEGVRDDFAKQFSHEVEDVMRTDAENIEEELFFASDLGGPFNSSLVSNKIQPINEVPPLMASDSSSHTQLPPPILTSSVELTLKTPSSSSSINKETSSTPRSVSPPCIDGEVSSSMEENYDIEEENNKFSRIIDATYGDYEVVDEDNKFTHSTALDTTAHIHYPPPPPSMKSRPGATSNPNPNLMSPKLHETKPRRKQNTSHRPPPPFVVRAANNRNSKTLEPSSLSFKKKKESKNMSNDENEGEVRIRSSSVGRLSSSSVTDRMHQSARHRTEKLLELERQKQEEEMEVERRECTFQPKLQTDEYRLSVTPKKRKEPKKLNIHYGHQTSSFSSSSQEGSLANMKQRLAERKKNQLASERLYQDAVEREALKCAIAGAVQERTLEACTFSPELNKKTETILKGKGYVPLPDRLGTVQRETSQNLQQLREHKEQNPDLTFHPQLNEHSRDLAYQRMEQEGTDYEMEVGERLCLEATNIASRKLELSEAHAKQLANAFTFKPTLSEGSKKIAEKQPKLQQDFLDRQKQWAEEEQLLEEAKKKAEDLRQKSLYKPNIRDSQSVVAARVHGEDDEERYERLSVVDQKRIDIAKKKIQEQYYSQFEYQPKLNEVSRLLGHDSSITELVNNPRGLTVKMKAQKEAEERLKKQCTFQPKLRTNQNQALKQRTFHETSSIGSPSQHQPSSLSSSTPPSRTRLSLKTNLEERFELEEKRAKELEDWRNTQKSVKELQELEECTFRPQLATVKKKKENSNIHHSPSFSSSTCSKHHNHFNNENIDDNRFNDHDSTHSHTSDVRKKTKPVVVRGLGRFLEVRAAANKKKKEKEEAMSVVERGGVKHPIGFGPHRGTTQVFAFELSQNNPKKRDKLKTEYENRINLECTFMPKTNESIGVKGLNQILDSDTEEEEEDLGS